MKVELGIDKRIETVELPDDHVLDILMSNEVTYDLTGEDEVRRALKDPIGSPRLKDIVKAGEKIVIITSDISRPMPSWKVLPAVLDELHEGGVSNEDVTVVFALGSHRHQTEEEMRHLAGDAVYDAVRCIDGDPDDVVHLGETSHGTPVDIVRTVVEADRRICLGNIEYHYFAGYSGGAKAIMPGVSTPSAIQVNHSMMVEDAAHAGNIATNPVRQDIEEACAMLGVDFIVNVVLSEHKEIVKAVAGDLTKAHRVGCEFLDQMYKKPIKKRADIVIVSQGGAPKDLNLYQTQKALDNSKHAVRDGGIVILVGSCKEGLGSGPFEQWLTEANCPQDILDRLAKKFVLGGHKAAAIAQVMNRADIYLVSDMEPDFVRSIFMTPFKTVQEAYDAAAAKLGADSDIIVMPFGGSTLPLPPA